MSAERWFTVTFVRETSQTGTAQVLATSAEAAEEQALAAARGVGFLDIMWDTNQAHSLPAVLAVELANKDS